MLCTRSLRLAAGIIALTASFGGSQTSPQVPSGDAVSFDGLQARYRDELADVLFGQAAASAETAAGLPGISADERALALRRAARVRAALGDLRESEIELKKALALVPGDQATLRALARLTRDRPEEALVYARGARDAGLEGILLEELGDDAGARKALRRELKGDPDDLEAWLALAAAAADKREAEEAAAGALRAAERAPVWRRGASYRLCAQRLLELGDTAKAARSLRRAVRWDPDDVVAWNGLARIHQTNPAALEAPDSAADAGAEEAAGDDELESMRRLIERDAAAGRRAQAEEAAQGFLEEVLDAPPWQQLDAYLIAARLWSGLGDERRAANILARAYDLDYISLAVAKAVSALPRAGLPNGLGERRYYYEVRPALEQGYFDLAAARAALGDAKGTHEALSQARAAAEPDDRAGVYRRMAKFLTSVNDLEGAQEIVKKGLRSCPDDPGLQKAAADLARQTSQHALPTLPHEALSVKVEAERVLKSWPAATANFYRREAEILASVKDFQGAQESLKKGLQASPDDATLLLLRGKIKATP